MSNRMYKVIAKKLAVKNTGIANVFIVAESFQDAIDKWQQYLLNSGIVDNLHSGANYTSDDMEVVPDSLEVVESFIVLNSNGHEVYIS